MASSVNSQMSSRGSDYEGLFVPQREEFIHSERKKKKVHSDSLGDSENGSEGRDLFAMLAAGEVKDNKTLKELIRRHEQDVSSSPPSKSMGHSPSMDRERKREKDRGEREKEKERERISSLSAGTSLLSKTPRTFGGSSNHSISTHQYENSHPQQRSAPVTSTAVSFGGVQGFHRQSEGGYPRNNPNTPERRVRGDSADDVAPAVKDLSPRVRRR